jgi:hypothetical protein
MAIYQYLFSKSRFLPLLIVISSFIFLFSGCGPDREFSQGHNDNAESFSMPVPARLQKHLFNEMLANIVVLDTGETFDLVIDHTNKTVSGTIRNIRSGPHTFELNFVIRRIKVATSRTTATIVKGTTVLISFASLTYPDDDGDGFTNLAELEAGTDPNDAGSHPPAELPRSSANYVMTDVIGISPFVGTSTSGNNSISLGTLPFGSTQTSQNGNYTVIAGP